MLLSSAFICIKKCRNLHSPVSIYVFGKAKAKIMRTGHNENESEQNGKQHYSQEYHQAETLTQKPAQVSNIPPRASAHPSAIVAVRPKYPRHVNNQQPITPFDGLGASPASTDELTRPAVARRRTDDLLMEPIFRRAEDILPIDEIDTFPSDVRAQTRSESKRAEYEMATLSQLDTLHTSFVQGKQEKVPPRAETRLWSATRFPSGVGQITRREEFSLERCFDDIRWWLLSPGRLEFLLWFIGAIVLVCLTSVFLLVLLAIWMS